MYAAKKEKTYLHTDNNRKEIEKIPIKLLKCSVVDRKMQQFMIIITVTITNRTTSFFHLVLGKLTKYCIRILCSSFFMKSK